VPDLQRGCHKQEKRLSESDAKDMIEFLEDAIRNESKIKSIAQDIEAVKGDMARIAPILANCAADSAFARQRLLAARTDREPGGPTDVPDVRRDRPPFDLDRPKPAPRGMPLQFGL
jgi:hypothetical protein